MVIFGTSLSEVIECHISDHRPILLSPSTTDFGPTPFKFYNSAQWNLGNSPRHYLRNIESKESLDYSQKAKIKWGIEADENSKFFHASKVDVARIVSRSPYYRSLSATQDYFLISSICATEIRDAVWDCGSDKSPGPDGYTFAFYKKFWDTIKKDVVVFVQDFFTSGSLPRGCNASFIALIPKVPNPMVISDFRPISLIGAQYKIITKVLANRLAKVIDLVIGHEQSDFIKNRQILNGPLMSCTLWVFNDTWIKWISGCLSTATSSILINGSPTREFNISRGLRQGDPLSPFLFIIAMEGLHVALEDAIAAEWSRDNIKCLVSILECFHRVSGLKINYRKSNLFGVGVPSIEVSQAALITGCNAMQTPFSYLGLPIDCNMANVKNWDPIVDKFSKRLSKWKSSMLSIGGRATLISSVLGSIGTYYLSLFPMPSTVNKKLESMRSHFFWGSECS
ncbi:RNA-directed DNA polymerase, eukaryota, reverse transcriptase zinc-binding domain protein [Tanacetum coccineum]